MNFLKKVKTTDHLIKRARRHKLLPNDCGDFWVLYSKYNTYSVSLLRGLVFEKNQGALKIVSAPFCTTTFTYDDPRLPKVLHHAEKFNKHVEGLIVRMFNYNGKWCFATKNNANIQLWKDKLDFKVDIFDVALGFDSHTLTLDPKNTYVFCVKSAKILIDRPPKRDKVYYIATYSNETLKELDLEAPAGTFPIKSIVDPNRAAIFNGDLDITFKTPTTHVVVHSRKTIFRRAGAEKKCLYKILFNKQGIDLIRDFPEYRDIVDTANREIEEYARFNLQERKSSKNAKLHSYIKMFQNYSKNHNNLDILKRLCRDYTEEYVFKDMEHFLAQSTNSTPLQRLIIT